ncbi:MAG: Ion transport 2 domain protein [Pseudonocardiales bacterium]|nr:Ion transport 2 domain protein [Pseudonocardiales bacterium]
MSERVGGPRVAAWERWSEWPLAVLAVIFLVAYSFDVLDTRLDSAWHDACRTTDYIVWLLFVVDYVGRVALANERLRYWWRHLADLAVIALPVLRPLRLLRIVMLLRVLNRRAAVSLRGKVIVYVAGAAVLLVYCAALAVLDAERRHSGANIVTFGDALWWAVVTMSTVGYGDHYPVTTEGRFVAVGLMVGGIALIGAVSASFATWLIDRMREVELDSQLTTRRDLRAVHAQLDRIEKRLDALGAVGTVGTVDADR